VTHGIYSPKSARRGLYEHFFITKFPIFSCSNRFSIFLMCTIQLGSDWLVLGLGIWLLNILYKYILKEQYRDQLGGGEYDDYAPKLL
jgi:hypothetical protein